MSKKISFLISSAVILVVPTLSFAAGAPTTGTPPLIVNIIDTTEKTALFIASAVVVILWIVTGILFLSAQGAPEKLNSAKKALFASIAGTLLVIVAASAIALVGHAFGIL